MNSSEILTCSLFQLPQDIFRVIFQYLSVDDLMKGEEAFLNNQELLSLYKSSLEGFILKEEITIKEEIAIRAASEVLISWIIDRKLLVEKLVLFQLRDLEMKLLDQIRCSLKSISFLFIYPDSDNSIPVISQLGDFPILTSVTFYDSHYLTKDELISFFSHNPQLEIVKIEEMHQLSNEIIPHLSNYCPKIKILSLSTNYWVNDETMSLLTQQRLFPNLKSLDIRGTRGIFQESLRQFILSHPLLSCLYLPYEIQYSDDFLVFYLRQVIFPSILNHNNNNDLESHSLAVSSLIDFINRRISDERNDVVNPEIFSVDILSHFYHKGCSSETLSEAVEIFSHLSKFPSMIELILQSQFISFIFGDMRPDVYIFPDHLLDILFNCGVFHDYFPLLVEKYRTHSSPLIWIFLRTINYHFSLLTTEELQTMIPIVLNELPEKDSTSNCLEIISNILQQPSSQVLVDPNDLLISLKSIELSNRNIRGVIDCLEIFISVNENYQQAFIKSNLLPQIMTFGSPSYLIGFTNYCLMSSQDGLLVDHLVNSGVFQYLLSNYSQFTTHMKNDIEPLFKLLIEFNNNKYSEIVKEMELPNELRSKLF